MSTRFSQLRPLHRFHSIACRRCLNNLSRFSPLAHHPFRFHLHYPEPPAPLLLTSSMLKVLTSTRLRASYSNQSAQNPANNIHFKPTSIHLSIAGESISHLWDTKVESFSIPAVTTLNQLLLGISHVCPEISRKFLRSSDLKPDDVLEILKKFQLGSRKSVIKRRDVDSLWGIFKWAADRNKSFKHFPDSYEVMAAMLTRVGMLREVELLLSAMEIEGNLLGSSGIFSNLIVAYIDAFELDRAILIYNLMKENSLSPSSTSCRSLLELLIERNKTQMAFCVFEDMVEVGVEFGEFELKILDGVIRLLCRDGKVQQARMLVKRIVATGLQPSDVVVNEIAYAYCEKKDFEDLLSFFEEIDSAPDTFIGNKIIFSLCRSSSVETAHQFLQELEHLGFCPKEITFGILIGWSCCSGKLRDALVYLSEIILRGMKPDLHCYNSLMSSLFKEGMWKHAREVFNEMKDNGIRPNMGTFGVLLAGYCKARRFDEVKATVGEMVSCGLINLSPVEDPLSKAFVLLGLNPRYVKVKRDNDVRFSRTEFYDGLGNGLYLDTDLDEFEQTLMGVLKESMFPDFNLLVVRECDLKNLKSALLNVDEMILWGQELSLSGLTKLVRALCASQNHFNALPGLLNKMPKLISLLDPGTLNMFLHSLGKEGFADVGTLIMNEMSRRHLHIENQTYTALIVGICEVGNLRNILHCWSLARDDKWLPELKDCGTLLVHLCQRKMLREVLELFGCMLASCPYLRAEICDIFLEKLCAIGFVESAQAQVDKLLQQGCVLNQTSYGHLIGGYCRENKISEALMAFDTLLAKNLLPCSDTLILLIWELCIANRIEEAIRIAKMGCIEHSSMSVSFCAALINGCCRAGNVAKADAIFLGMFSQEMISNGEIYNELLQGHCQGDDFKKVQELFGAMIRKNFTLSISSYRKLVHIMCKKGLVLLALNLKRFMLAECGSFSLIMHNILIFYLLHTGNYCFIEGLLDDLKGLGLQLDNVTYNFLVYGFSKCKDVTKLVHYFNAMISKDLRPSNRSLRAVICHFCVSGKVQKALDLSKEMELRGQPHGSIIQHAIVEALLSDGRVDEVERFLGRMAEKDLIPNNISYENLIQKFSLCGRLDIAVDLFSIMLKKGNVPSSASYDSLVYNFCVCSKLDRAMEFFTEMLERNLTPSISTWDVLVNQFCQNGKTSEAERLLICMLKSGITPTRKIFSSVIDKYFSEKNLCKASELMQMMQQNGYEPDFESQWSLISDLRNSTNKDDSRCSQGFLSKLFSDSGFFSKLI
ncbi:hypothetical protein Ancab_018791 [Ancistrocladus abbreviatus]